MRPRLAHAVATLAALALAGAANAQASASHTVAISIPALLRLRIDHHEASDHARVPIHVRVEGSRSEVEPASTLIEVLANTGWTLSARFEPEHDSDGIELRWQTDGGSGVLLASPSPVARGRATGGWRAIEVRYAVGGVPIDGAYRGVIAYTLARP